MSEFFFADRSGCPANQMRRYEYKYSSWYSRCGANWTV